MYRWCRFCSREIPCDRTKRGDLAEHRSFCFEGVPRNKAGWNAVRPLQVLGCKTTLCQRQMNGARGSAETPQNLRQSIAQYWKANLKIQQVSTSFNTSGPEPESISCCDVMKSVDLCCF